MRVVEPVVLKRSSIEEPRRMMSISALPLALALLSWLAWISSHRLASSALCIFLCVSSDLAFHFAKATMSL